MINPLATDWPIKQRSEICNATQRPFVPGEAFYTLLYREGDRVPPWIAGWAPTIVFGTIGLYLLQLRSSNRDPSDFRGLLPRRMFAR